MTKKSKKIKLRTWHRTVGLIGALWIIVLGVTGFFLDHPEYRWLWKDVLPLSIVNSDVQESTQKRFSKLYQINPTNVEFHISGGAHGLSWSIDGGNTWKASKIVNDTPIIYGILPNSIWSQIYLATDNGIWCSTDQGKEFHLLSLKGEKVKAFSFESNENRLLAVLDNSRIVRITIDKHNVLNEYTLSFPSHLLPESFDLNRFTKDLHFARGISDKYISVLSNDIGGLAFIFLAITGVLYWYFPKRWNKRQREGIKISRTVRYRTMRWLYYLHGPVVGVVAFIPIVYLSITGILIDHSKELSPLLRNIKISAIYLTPVYNPQSWDDEIRSIVGYPEKPDTFSIGTRFGMYTTYDSGVTWVKEEKIEFAWMMWRVGDKVVVKGMGSPSFILDDDGTRIELDKNIQMMSDVTSLPDGTLIMIGHHTRTIDGKCLTLHPPRPDMISWFDFMETLHSGKIIHVQWKWMNDLFAILTLILAATGGIRLFRRFLSKPKGETV